MAKRVRRTDEALRRYDETVKPGDQFVGSNLCCICDEPLGDEDEIANCTCRACDDEYSVSTGDAAPEYEGEEETAEEEEEGADSYNQLNIPSRGRSFSESTMFDKFVDDTVLKEHRGRKVDAPETPQRRRARLYKELPQNRIRVR